MLLELPYKGNRDYLHGTDIFQFLDNYFRSKYAFLDSLSFRAFANTQLKISFGKPSSPMQTIYAEGIVKYPLKETQFWLVDSGSIVTTRTPFDESIITKFAIIESDQVVLDRPNKFKLIEKLVILTKFCSNFISLLNTGRWILGKIHLSQPLPLEWHRLVITRIAYLGKKRLSRYNICVDSVNIGQVLFIVSSQ